MGTLKQQKKRLNINGKAKGKILENTAEKIYLSNEQKY